VGIAEQIVQSVEQLPEEAAREVLDFARFLAQRETARQEQDLVAAQQLSLSDWDNQEDDVWNDAPGV
jgi:hypothetical protein